MQAMDLLPGPNPNLNIEMKSYLLILACVLGSLYAVSAQQDSLSTQEIYGKVLDAETRQPLPGAEVWIANLQNGVVTDGAGNFSLRVSIGRHTILVGFIGYEQASISLLVNAGAEPYLEIPLRINPEELEEIEVTAAFNKAETVNATVYTSGRSFSVEDAYRYAGTLGDPARMVRSYAGVVPERDDRNDIIIRGNSPTGIVWRLDGIEIPNPNHYGGIGLTGNTTTLLNANLLDNSDFLTGAFPGKYGNATAGVFDLRLRRPNPKKYQFWFQTGWNGLELGTEGPLSSKEDPASFMAVYRYSFLDAMSALGIDFGINPQYQDFTTKVQLPVSGKLDLAVLGLWSTSYIDLDERELEEDTSPETPHGDDLRTGSDLALLGLNANYKINDRSFLKAGISGLYNEVKTDIDTFNLLNDASRRVFEESSQENKYSLFADYSLRTSRNNLLRLGTRLDRYDIAYHKEGFRADSSYGNFVENEGALHLLRFYAEDEYFFNTRWKARLGLHSQHLDLTGEFVLEPRAGIQYSLNEKQQVSMAYGLHHQMQPRPVYFVETQTPSGPIFTNENLSFTRAHHLVLGYDLSFTENLRLKAETYYQALSQIPVSRDASSSFSLANVGADFYIPSEDSLVNEGLGRNYGVELTLEKFLSKGYYFMLNGSLFESEFQAADGEWYNTAFNVNYMWNALAGYEFWINPKFALGADVRATKAGGKPYTPVNEAASMARNEVVRYDDQAFTQRFDDYFRLDLRVYYRINYSKFYIEFALDMQNLTNHENVYRTEFVPETGTYNTFYHSSFFLLPTFKAIF